MSGQLGDIHGKQLLANNPNDLTEAGRAKDPVGKNDGTATNRYVIPLVSGAPSAATNQAAINRILKALKGAGIIHFKNAGNTPA